MFEMSWQDLVFMSGNIIFFLALIPSIMSENKPSKWTSLSTALVQTVYIATYYSLSLTYATIAGTVSTIAWWILYFQKR
jgi:threonine/homoserine/homoserine lactone efflux protein